MGAVCGSCAQIYTQCMLVTQEYSFPTREESGYPILSGTTFLCSHFGCRPLRKPSRTFDAMDSSVGEKKYWVFLCAHDEKVIISGSDLDKMLEQGYVFRDRLDDCVTEEETRVLFSHFGISRSAVCDLKCAARGSLFFRNLDDKRRVALIDAAEVLGGFQCVDQANKELNQVWRNPQNAFEDIEKEYTWVTCLSRDVHERFEKVQGEGYVFVSFDSSGQTYHFRRRRSEARGRKRKGKSHEAEWRQRVGERQC